MHDPVGAELTAAVIARKRQLNSKDYALNTQEQLQQAFTELREGTFLKESDRR